MTGSVELHIEHNFTSPSAINMIKYIMQMTPCPTRSPNEQRHEASIHIRIIMLTSVKLCLAAEKNISQYDLYEAFQGHIRLTILRVVFY